MSSPDEKGLGDKALEKAIEWGWHEPPQSIVERARQTLQWQYRNTKDIAIGMGYITAEEAESILRGRPEHRQELDWLAQNSLEVRENIDRIQAIHLGQQYTEMSDQYFDIHPLMQSDREIQKEANLYRAYLTICQGQEPVLVFAEATDLKAFIQQTGPALQQSHLRKELGEVAIALGPREAVMRGLNRILRDADDSNKQSVTVVHSSALRHSQELKVLDEMHAATLREGGTDIHIDVLPNGAIAVRYRVHGDMEDMPIRLGAEEYLNISRFLLKVSDAQRSSAMMVDPADGRYQYSDKTGNIVNVRASFIPTQHIQVHNAPSVSIRLRMQQMNEGEINLLEKGVSQQVMDLIGPAIKQGQGLVMLVGPTNSGKSTTIAGLLSLHRKIFGDKKSRLSAEDPVERFIPGMNQFEVAVHRRGKDGFAVLSKNFMRHDPDVILLGEIRDEESAEYAVQFADTGHLVFSTLHAKTSSSALQRLLNTLPVDKPLLRQAAIESTSVIMAQRLVKKLCQHCALPPRPLNDDERNEIRYLRETKGLDITEPKSVRDVNREGCRQCRGGIIGVMPINDVLVLDDDVRLELLNPNAKLAHVARSAVKINFEAMATDYIEKGIVGWEALLV